MKTCEKEKTDDAGACPPLAMVTVDSYNGFVIGWVSERYNLDDGTCRMLLERGWKEVVLDDQAIDNPWHGA